MFIIGLKIEKVFRAESQPSWQAKKGEKSNNHCTRQRSGINWRQRVWGHGYKTLVFCCLASSPVFLILSKYFNWNHCFLIHQPNISSLVIKHPVRNSKSVVIKFTNAYFFITNFCQTFFAVCFGRVRNLKFQRSVKLDITSLSW